MDPSKIILLPKRRSLKNVKYDSINLTKLPPKKLLSSPIENVRIVNLRKPLKPPVFVNLVDRFNLISNSTKENISQSSNNEMKTIPFSDELNLSIKMLETSPGVEMKKVTTDTLESLVKRGISVISTNLKSPNENGKFFKLGPVATDKWFKCPDCPGYFITKLDLKNHETAHHSKQKNNDFGLPVVDLSKDESRDKLISLGIQHYVTITNMNEIEGCSSFGIPIVSVQGSAKSKLCNIMAMGADGILSLGSLNEIRK